LNNFATAHVCLQCNRTEYLNIDVRSFVSFLEEDLQTGSGRFW